MSKLTIKIEIDDEHGNRTAQIGPVTVLQFPMRGRWRDCIFAMDDQPMKYGDMVLLQLQIKEALKLADEWNASHAGKVWVNA